MKNVLFTPHFSHVPPFSLLFHPFLSCSSLELFFASSQNSKLLYGEPPTSPRASRKFSSPPPLSITKSSSPNRRRKLSLNIPIITGGKALDLAALSCSPNGYASMHSTMSPFSKTTLDINKLYISSTMASKIPDEGESKAEGKAEESVANKQGQSLCPREYCRNNLKKKKAYLKPYPLWHNSKRSAKFCKT